MNKDRKVIDQRRKYVKLMMENRQCSSTAMINRIAGSLFLSPRTIERDYYHDDRPNDKTVKK